MNVIPYEEYDAAELVRSFSTRIVRGLPQRGVAFASLSPFDVPESVTAEVTPLGECVIRFGYVNREPPEDAPRVADTSGIALLLAKHTKKVLAVIVPNAKNRLAEGSLTFDLHTIMELALTLPTEAGRACARNAVLVRAILETLPASYRKQIGALFG